MKVLNHCVHLSLSYLYNANINICQKQYARTGPQSGCWCLHGANTSLALYNFRTRKFRANRNAMPAWHYFFYAEPLISRFSSEIYITLLQQPWQTVLVWNLYPIFILLNQLVLKMTRPSLSFWCICINSSTCIFINVGKPSLVQIMACRLLGTKPLSEPMLEYCKLDYWEQNRNLCFVIQ